ncbi:pentapeptide repeat-containing protein [Pleurocapsa sp. FMAR1]|uniref:pentapeptide repeat-containing protein n=1 Tax=Pleurocapsa sp. FMAR1 TaxID=3040204 RepID=UPI0029C69272|nr:pentapeptide repeat-containing protein [Pleurocapsa sp. FMAR1]
MIEMTVDELLCRYAAGERNFSAIRFVRDIESRRGRVDLGGADLRGVNLCGSDLHGANLSGAILSYASLREANLDEVVAVGTMLRASCLWLSSLRSADLTGANMLAGSYLSADLTGANMYGVTMCQCTVDGADFSNGDLELATIFLVDFSKVDVRGFFTHEQAFFWKVTLPNGVYVE